MTTTAVIKVEPIPRRWWQRREVRLVCSCKWESEQTWPERPIPELAFLYRITMRAFAEIHLNTAHPNGSTDHDEECAGHAMTGCAHIGPCYRKVTEQPIRTEGDER